MKFFSLISAIFLVVGCQTIWARPTTTNNPDALWAQLEQTTLPSPPADWKTTPPTDEQVAAFKKQYGKAVVAAAEKFHAFYTHFPENTNALKAKMIECMALRDACLRTDVNAFDDWEKALNTALADPQLPADTRFALRVQAIQRIGAVPGMADNVRDAELQKLLWQLAKDYPDQEAPYALLLNLARSAPETEAHSIANQILAQKKVPEDVKEQTLELISHLDMVGKPVDIQFTAIDGRQVDLSQMKGKVVLVDFWATWCMPCVMAMPDVKETYDKFHSKGFEVVGISLDDDKTALTRFILEHDIPWPQYFDGLHWQNKFAVKFGIQAIPAMWLIDKNGNLQTQDAHADLQERVEKLLKQN
ncbi:MAG TPA: TlpA disulfide reductase family protein [Verrucomicrobiae bacterium]|jgi:thiol-disulfide isomerase/thioredoxin|nr:TlpA disulfide reductase family protein [Verrucomicrobiae bacterium]